jgi:hypothetical protein
LLKIENSLCVFILFFYKGSDAIASGTFTFYSPSQIFWTASVRCGPGTAQNRKICSAAKNPDLSGDGKGERDFLKKNGILKKFFFNVVCSYARK